ncbi:MAG: DNA-directed RNA polymerase subunit omega [Acutalibacteraceae bacterium]|nr:DNA-directed RNA polymerase subunit omega [Acutalibacteraceae bacterium]
MLNPAIGELIKKYDSRYKLVHDVANRARKIAQKAEENNEILVEKTVSLAINEICAEMKDE